MTRTDKLIRLESLGQQRLFEGGITLNSVVEVVKKAVKVVKTEVQQTWQQLELQLSLRDLVFKVKEAVKSVAAKLSNKPEIRETERSITVKLAGAVASISGEDREWISAASVEAVLAGKNTEDALATLEALGFKVSYPKSKIEALNEQLLGALMVEDDNEFALEV